MGTKRVDVTDQVDFGWADDEHLPITKCICNRKFPIWHEVLSIYDDNPWECPSCGRKFVFSNRITVYEVVDE